MADGFIDIGSGNLVNTRRLLAVVGADSSPVRRMVQEARDRGVLVDATSGRKTRSVLVMDSDHIICSALTPEDIGERCGKETSEESPKDREDSVDD